MASSSSSRRYPVVAAASQSSIICLGLATVLVYLRGSHLRYYGGWLGSATRLACCVVVCGSGRRQQDTCLESQIDESRLTQHEEMHFDRRSLARLRGHHRTTTPNPAAAIVQATKQATRPSAAASAASAGWHSRVRLHVPDRQVAIAGCVIRRPLRVQETEERYQNRRRIVGSVFCVWVCPEPVLVNDLLHFLIRTGASQHKT